MGTALVLFSAEREKEKRNNGRVVVIGDRI